VDLTVGDQYTAGSGVLDVGRTGTFGSHSGCAPANRRLISDGAGGPLVDVVVDVVSRRQMRVVVVGSGQQNAAVDADVVARAFGRCQHCRRGCRR